ncbi:MAG: endo-type 6-aminohexanoate oligomer hydrolase [uncultured Rubrobacteraceae bacterium]|uniref:Endo-type 6-aminohexanoate oligomer hydrolase n=1 Tax=uncultured Rubrobacteraceae bacterium TaxID=349277 RepID=A0A6J4S9L8_9ACTN|nr:MAG: endo-type 6-aminohexanoate oligomer hydrolase [uncultured Rubrobacteraceae bacterium]
MNNLCDVPGVLVGHATDGVGMTGCTAVLFDRPAVVGVDVRGSSPETRGTAGLGQTGIVRHRQGILLTGGSAFGLSAADGMIRYLEERGVGLDVGVARIPLVAAAVLFDLAVGSSKARPDAAMGYEAAASAVSGPFEEGSVGAGTGASVGNILGTERAMKGGLGTASARPVGGDGLIVAALVAVNAFGDVRDPGTGETLAGPRLDGGGLGDTVGLLPEAAARVRWGENTTLGVVATNAILNTSQVQKVAEMAHDGLARTISPVHTTVDGDLVFAAAVGEVEATTDVVGAWGARVLSEAVVRAVRAAKGLPGLPSVSDLPL